LINQLVALVFCARNEAHLAHWNTDSLSEHLALNEFYDDVLGPLDELVEGYTAAFGKIGTELPEDEADEESEKPILARLKEQTNWINKNRSKVCRNVSALENIVDELSGVYLKAIYKLENLS
jgi:hypothetical protein